MFINLKRKETPNPKACKVSCVYNVSLELFDGGREFPENIERRIRVKDNLDGEKNLSMPVG